MKLCFKNTSQTSVKVITIQFPIQKLLLLNA